MLADHGKGTLAAPTDNISWPDDYVRVRHLVEAIVDWGETPLGIDNLTATVGVDAETIRRTLDRWCGLSLEAFAQTVTAGSLRQLLAGSTAALTGGVAAQVHDFEPVVAATLSDDATRRGASLAIVYGFHESPFGTALLMMTGGSVCGLAFADGGRERCAALDDMVRRWPSARYCEAPDVTGANAERIFGSWEGGSRAAVSLVLIGTAFDLAVWQVLLRVPKGRIVSYADIARHLGRPDAARAVGTANGRNPISFVVPCHRALRGDGALGGYYWGITRKRAMIAWEAGRTRQSDR